MASKPIMLPEPFNGETPWDEWIIHFGNVADVNKLGCWPEAPMAEAATDRTCSKGVPAPARSVPGVVRPGEESADGKVRTGGDTRPNSRPARRSRAKDGLTSRTTSSPSSRRPTPPYNMKPGNCWQSTPTYDN